MLIMPTRRPPSSSGMCRTLRAYIFDATVATLSPGEHVTTVFVISADTGNVYRSLLCNEMRGSARWVREAFQIHAQLPPG
jgi:hypothetical protein